MPSNTWDIHSYHPRFQVEEFPYLGIILSLESVDSLGKRQLAMTFLFQDLDVRGSNFILGLLL